MVSKGSAFGGVQGQRPWPSPGLRIEALTLRYGGCTVFKNLDLLVEGGRFVVLRGPSGIGKSSLLRIAAGWRLPPPAASRPPTAGRSPVQ